MKCSVCGCENEAAVTVCGECGTALTPPVAQTVCCHCGKQIRPTAKYCVYCGSKQDEVPATIEMEPLVISVEDAPAAEPVVAEDPVVAAEPVDEAPASAPVEEPAAQPPHSYVPAAASVYTPPAYQLPTRRGFWKMLLLGILTGMIYPMVILSRISVEINMVASRHDGKRTMHFLWMPFVGVLTLGVYFFVWIHKLCGRIGNELRRRQVGYKFSAGSFWLWNFLWGILGAIVTSIAVLAIMQIPGMRFEPYLVGVAGGIVSSIGPFIFIHKLMRAMNLMNADYNEKG